MYLAKFCVYSCLQLYFYVCLYMDKTFLGMKLANLVKTYYFCILKVLNYKKITKHDTKRAYQPYYCLGDV